MDAESQSMPAAGDTVAVGMSGGVDSTLTAMLLSQRGCHVIGVTMSLWDGSLPRMKSGGHLRESCFGPGEKRNIDECRKFCAAHGIEYHVIDVRKQYKQNVLDYFKSEYRSGRTPNPCIRCNQMIKFGALLDGVRSLGIPFDYFCTGHYAKIVRPCSGIFGSDVRPYMVAGAADASKDQTYFLYRVPSEILEKVRFPLAQTQKKDVFALAEQLHLEAAHRKESQDFIGEDYFNLIFSDAPSKPGDIIDLDGHILGRHRGIEHYTVGQRRGLGVALNYPVYVHSIDAKANCVVLAPNDALFSAGLIADDFVWPGNIEPSGPIEAMVKIRLASRPVRARIERLEKSGGYTGTPWRITFETPQRAVAPGQSAVLYDGDVIIGGGIIAETV